MSALRLRRLEIRAMPGFRHGEGFTLDDLDHDVVVLLGPNGSGKTTTARAIQGVLWPERREARSAYVDAEFRLDDLRRLAGLEAGRVAWHDGVAACEAPNAGDGERSGHYRLALHDMVSESGEDLARALLRELAGGYDVRAAAGTLETAVRRPTAKLRAFSDATQALREARDGEVAVRARERELDALRAQVEALAADLREEPTLNEALAFRRAKRQLRVARREFRAFASSFATMAPDEVSALEAIERRRAGLEQEERVAWAATRDHAPSGRAGVLAFPLPASLFATLEGGAETLAGVERDLRQASREVEAAAGKVDVLVQALTRELGADLDDLQLAALRDENHRALVDRLRELFATRATYEALAGVRDFLGAEAVSDSASLRRGRDRLLEWLRQPAPPEVVPAAAPPTKAILAVAAALAVVGAALLAAGLIVPGAALLGAAVGVAGAGWMLRSRETPVATVEDRRPALAAEFARTGLASPDWSDPAAVAGRLDELTDALAEAGRVERCHQYRDALQPRLGALALALEEAERENARLVAAGRLPSPTDPVSLARVLALLDDLLKTLAARRAAEAARQTLAGERAERLSALAEAVRPYGYPAPEEAASAGRIAQSLREWNALSQKIRGYAEQGDELIRERTDRLTRLGVASLDDVRALVARRPEYLAARDRRGACRAAYREAAAPRESVRRYADETEETLAERLAAMADVREERDQVHLKILDIEHAIANAKDGTSIEVALAEHARTRDDLAEERSRQAAALVANALTDHVDRLSRERDMPLVFERAREVFRQVTEGRYDLRFDQVEFRAWDRVQGIELSLDALSSGTRVQLLLAVRLAFVQLREAVALPLLLDETLATSDPERSAEVVRAVGELLGDGRQAFYFTTQPDEARQWQDGLPGRVRVVRLDEVRRLAVRPELWSAPPADAWLDAPPPVPEDPDYDAYRERLGVPPRLAPTTVGQAHLWHLFDDVETLYRALRFRKPEWGRFEAIADSVLPASVARTVRARARALEAVLTAFRIGRPLDPVTVEVLRASGISKHAMDNIAEHCAEEMTDPNRLHLRLTTNEPKIPSVQEKMRRLLAEHMETQSLVDLRPPLAPSQVLDEALQAVLDELEAGILVPEDVQRLVQALPFASETVSV